MLNRKIVLVAITCFLLGIVTMYLWNQSSPKEDYIDAELTSKVMNNCTPSLQESDKLVKNISSAYTELGTCFVKQSFSNI